MIYKSSPRLRRWLRRRKDATTYWLVRIALWLPRRFELPRALALADRLGDLAYLFLVGTRRLALQHIEIALGADLSPEARRRVVRASFRNLARSLCEVALFDRIRPRIDDYVVFEGMEHWEEGRACPRGMIAITGHIGNWELLAASLGLKGNPLAAVARRINEPRLNQLVIDFRASNGVETIQRDTPGAGRQILRVLRERGVLALLMDQDTKVPSISVPFFGRAARTAAGAALLAVRRDLPVIPTFAHRRAEGGHCISVLAPIYAPASGDRQQDVRALTLRINQALEGWIRDHPEEWVWWHRRWRRPPVARLDLDADRR